MSLTAVMLMWLLKTTLSLAEHKIHDFTPRFEHIPMEFQKSSLKRKVEEKSNEAKTAEVHVRELLMRSDEQR